MPILLLVILTLTIFTFSMPRSAVPSLAQQEQLLEYIEEKQWLVTGHARTANARQKMNSAWQEIAAKLNSDGSGCIKSPQQWAKVSSLSLKANAFNEIHSFYS